MNQWFYINLGDAMLATEALYQLKDDFNDHFQKMNCLKGMTLFYRHEAEARLHCEVMVYFSPASAPIAKKLDAKPCKIPSMTGLSYLAGTDQALEPKEEHQQEHQQEHQPDHPSNNKPTHNQ